MESSAGYLSQADIPLCLICILSRGLLLGNHCEQEISNNCSHSYRLLAINML